MSGRLFIRGLKSLDCEKESIIRIPFLLINTQFYFFAKKIKIRYYYFIEKFISCEGGNIYEK